MCTTARPLKQQAVSQRGSSHDSTSFQGTFTPKMSKDLIPPYNEHNNPNIKSICGTAQPKEEDELNFEEKYSFEYQGKCSNNSESDMTNQGKNYPVRKNDNRYFRGDVHLPTLSGSSACKRIAYEILCGKYYSY